MDPPDAQCRRRLTAHGAGLRRARRGGSRRGERRVLRHGHARVPQLRGEPDCLSDEAGAGMAGGFLGERHPGAAFSAVRRHPGRRAGPGKRLRHRDRRPGPGEDHPGRHAVLHRASLPGDRSGAVVGTAHPRGADTGAGRSGDHRDGRSGRRRPQPPRSARRSKACASSIWGTSSPAPSAPCCWPTSGPT